MGSLFGGFNINPFKNRSVAGGLLLGGGLGGILANKNNTNAEIDSQMQDPGAAPAMLDPNQMPGQSAGLSSYGQLRRRMNYADAGQAGAAAQAGAMGDLSQARSQVAQRGGMTGGAGERLSMAGMNNAANARQENAYGLMRSNLQTDSEDIGNQQAWAQRAKLANQEMQGNLYGGRTMANATLNANRPKGLFGLGIMGL